jgi:hypothetical protein
MKVRLYILIFCLTSSACFFSWEDSSGSNINTSEAPFDSDLENQISDDLVKWAGTWQLKSETSQGLTSTLVIGNEKPGQFNFSLSATFINTVKGTDEEMVDNAHFGELEGIAILSSKNEAYYDSDEFPDYKLIFKFVKSNLIRIEEINSSSSADYGVTPMAGYNVRFAGDYKKES